MLAVTVGRADLRLAAVMACNFAVTALWPDNIGVVGIADIASIAALAAIGGRGFVLATLYIIAAMVNAIGSIAHLPPETTYAILDPIGWVMLAVLANVDTGLRRRIRSVRGSVRRDNLGGVHHVAQRGQSGDGMAVDCGENK